MSTLNHHSWAPLAALVTGAAMICGPAQAQLPVTGVPVPQLQAFDDAMQQYMAQHGIGAGVLGVMRNGTVVYQRGFGHDFHNHPLPENTPMRIASCSKPLTAAAIRVLADAGYLSLTDHAFNLGQSGGGILNFTPWFGVDPRLADITVENILDHRGGWDRDIFGDPHFMARTIAEAMDVPSPPGRSVTVRYMLGHALQYTPGTPHCDENGQPAGCYNGDSYSNFGYMVLGMIVEAVYGQPLETALEELVLTPDMWVPGTEIIHGRTFRADQSAREPLYWSDEIVNSVFDPGGPVLKPYGWWEQEVLVGAGNLVAGAAPLLRFTDNYSANSGVNSGVRLNGTHISAGHEGLLTGTSSVIAQQADGTNIVVLFNRGSGDIGYAGQMSGIISSIISAGGFTWPTRDVEGSWIDLGLPSQTALGNFDDPYRGMNSALAGSVPGTRLCIKPGASSWTGTVTQRLRLSAPLGTARIGQ